MTSWCVHVIDHAVAIVTPCPMVSTSPQNMWWCDGDQSVWLVTCIQWCDQPLDRIIWHFLLVEKSRGDLIRRRRILCLRAITAFPSRCIRFRKLIPFYLSMKGFRTIADKRCIRSTLSCMGLRNMRCRLFRTLIIWVVCTCWLRTFRCSWCIEYNAQGWCSRRTWLCETRTYSGHPTKPWST